MKIRLFALLSLFCWFIGTLAADVYATVPGPDWGGPQVKCTNIAYAFQGIDRTGTTDSGAGFTTAFAALAKSGQAACIPGGTYKFTTQALIPPGGNLTIVGSPQAVLTGNMTLVDNNTAIIDAPYSTTAYSSTMTGNVTLGPTR